MPAVFRSDEPDEGKIFGGEAPLSDEDGGEAAFVVVVVVVVGKTRSSPPPAPAPAVAVTAAAAAAAGAAEGGTGTLGPTSLRRVFSLMLRSKPV